MASSKRNCETRRVGKTGSDHPFFFPVRVWLGCWYSSQRKAFSVLTFHHFFSPQKQEDMMTMTMRAFSPTVTLTRRKDSPSSSSRSAKCTTTTTTTKACLTTTRTHPFSAPLKASHRRLHIRATNDDDDSKKARKEEDKEEIPSHRRGRNLDTKARGSPNKTTGRKFWSSFRYGSVCVC